MVFTHEEFFFVASVFPFLSMCILDPAVMHLR